MNKGTAGEASIEEKIRSVVVTSGIDISSVRELCIKTTAIIKGNRSVDIKMDISLVID